MAMPKGFKHSEDTKRRISLANKGRAMSSEAREKISTTKTGKKRPPFSEEWKEHLRKFGKANPFFGKRHSAETSVKMSQATKGKKRPNSSGERCPAWKGGRSSIAHLIRQSMEYKVWRTAVFERDNYTCQECGARGGYLNADHIQPFAHYPALRFALDNGRTLCNDCHKKTPTFGSRALRVKRLVASAVEA